MNSKQQLLHPCHLPRTLLRAGLQEHGMDLRLQFTFTYCEYRLAQTTDPLVFKLILNFAFTSPRWGLLCFFFFRCFRHVASLFGFRAVGNLQMNWCTGFPFHNRYWCPLNAKRFRSAMRAPRCVRRWLYLDSETIHGENLEWKEAGH